MKHVFAFLLFCFKGNILWKMYLNTAGKKGSLLFLNIHSLNDYCSTLHLYFFKYFILQIRPEISRQISDKSWTAILKITVIWNMTPCKLVFRYQCFGRAYSLQVQAVQFRRTLLLQSSGWFSNGLS
jgi:hypothetical protein